MVAIVATLGAAAAAFRIDPDVVADVSTPSTGLWVPAPSSGDIVRVDAASGGVTARVNVAAEGAEIRVAERDSGVIVVDESSGRVALVDPALHEIVREVRTTGGAAAAVDIGPGAIVTASGAAVSVVDLDVTVAESGAVPAAVRSAVALDDGAVVETGTSRYGVAADGAVDDPVDSAGRLVRIDDRVLVARGERLEALNGSRQGCFAGDVNQASHLIGTDHQWVIAVVGSVVHVADLENDECVAVDLGETVGALGEPVVAGRRVFVPERGSGVVHIVEPSRGTAISPRVLVPGDLRLRTHEGFVVAYDMTRPGAALLDETGIVRLVDTSVDERGFVTQVDGEGNGATLVGDDDGPGAGAGDGVDGVSSSSDAPIIDAGVLATTLRNADEEPEPIPDDDLVANFAFSATTVTVGESVRFVDGSTGGPDAWLWDFGDGTGAEGPEAEKAWDEAGTYPVTLRVSRGVETDEISLAITVVPAEVPLPPAADFVFSTTVVAVGKAVDFEDRSDGEIDRWRWDFGDGDTATSPDVSHAWTTPGRYTVQLTVANDQGSDSASVVIEVIEGLEPPVAVITVAKTEVDLGEPLTFQAASATDPASFSWDFGDGRTSSGDEVVHVFLTEGTFTVEVTAQNDAGADRADVEIVVAPPTQPPAAAIGTLPDVIEVGDVVELTSLSTNSPDTEEWTFGDGQTASGSIVSHSWAAEGTYLLTLTATNVAGTDTVTETIEVVAELPPPVAQIGDFNESPWVGETTVFIDASIDATSWLWDFGDGVTSNAPNPLHSFSTPGQKLVSLTVTNRNGSDSTAVVVEPRLEPIASFFASATGVRTGEVVAFTDASVNAVSWTWDFGDGNSSALQNPTHSYTATGTYGVTLAIESATGDIDTFGPVSITVDPAAPLLDGIDVIGDDITLTTAAFQAVAAATSGPIDLFQFDPGDGSALQQSVDGAFAHIYGTAGTYTVRIQARGPIDGWTDWTTIEFAVTDPPPPLVAIAGSVPSSAEIGTVALAGVELGGSGPIETWRWEIRQGGGILAQYTGQTAAHAFTAAGAYQIVLIAESPVAAVDDARVARPITITLPDPPAILSIVGDPSPATTGLPVDFATSVDGSVSVWEWSYEGLPFVVGDATGQHVFNTAGTFDVTLRVTGPFGQQDTETIQISVGPAPNITSLVATPATTVLVDTNVTLTATEANGLPGLSWSWTIAGCENGALAGTGPVISYTFSTPGNCTVTVTATDGNLVSDSEFVFMTVQGLEANFIHANAGPLTVAFTDTSTGPAVTGWTWSFVSSGGAVGTDPPNSNQQNPVVTFAASGSYDVTLTVSSGAYTDDVTYVIVVPDL
ncbi:MAG: PKD domain-containing protein [Actinomycetota bacterium]